MKDEVDIAQKLSTFAEHWQPRSVASFNGHDVMVAKVKGEFTWHEHDETDDLILVLKGKLDIELRDRTTVPSEGQPGIRFGARAAKARRYHARLRNERSPGPWPHT